MRQADPTLAAICLGLNYGMWSSIPETVFVGVVAVAMRYVEPLHRLMPYLLKLPGSLNHCWTSFWGVVPCFSCILGLVNGGMFGSGTGRDVVVYGARARWGGGLKSHWT